MNQIKKFVKSNWDLFLMFGLYMFIHLYKLTTIPYGLHVDETGMAYDAFNLSHWGFDRYLNSYPLYLVNYGGGQSSLYCYLCAIFLKIFKLSIFTIRMPAILNAILIFIYGSLIVYKIFKSKKSVLLYQFLVTIMPYFIMVTRFGLDCNLMLGFSTMFIYYLLKAIENNKIINYIIAGVIGGIVLYTYALSYFVLPIFIILTFIYLIYIKKFKVQYLIAFAIPLFFIALPLILIQIINMFDLEEIKFLKFTLTKLPAYRSSEISLFNFMKNIKPLFKSIFMYDWLPYNTIAKYGTIYYVSIVLFTIGFVHSIYSLIKNLLNKQYETKTVIIIWFCSVLFVGSILGGNGPNANKLNAIFFSLIIFIVDFFIILSSSKLKLKRLIIIMLLLCYCYLFISFFKYYFYKYDNSRELLMFEASGEDVVNYIDKEKKFKDKTTYMNMRNLNLFSDLLVPAYKINLYNWENNYENYVFILPEEIDTNANYVIKKSNKDYVRKIQKLKFKYIEFKDYWLFYN